jgi:hypothetical protein
VYEYEGAIVRRGISSLFICLLMVLGFGTRPAQGATDCKVVALGPDDAVIKAPGNHKIIFENDDVRVLAVSIPPHTKEPMHTHMWPSVMYIDAPTVTNYQQDGKPPGPMHIPKPRLPGQYPIPRWMPPEPTLHATENFSDTEWHAIRIELKHAGCRTTVMPAGF